ncbi:hypothetical protein [Streptomyces albidoflavus]|uniref:hypothetical protein n=1 Tax=Streptomyces albidoflavus TaxID=1886 RepID=UPI0034888040
MRGAVAESWEVFADQATSSILRSDSTPRRRMAGPRSYLPEPGDRTTRPALARLTR